MHWRSRLIHPSAGAPQGFRSLVPPVYRGSTVLFDSQADARDDWRAERGYTYGVYGTPTVLELGARIAELEGARHTFIVPGGQAALALVDLAFTEAGSHVLLPSSVYGPNAEMGRLLERFGVETEIYDAMIGGGIARLIRSNTSLIWTETPGSITMEVQDVPAIVDAARSKGVPVALDNTYAAGVLFDAFAAGVDVSVQALTKYVSGHSDVLLGSVSVGSEVALERVAATWRLLGMAVSPDDASLALRGLQTMGTRLAHLEAAAVKIARWLAEQPAVEVVLHPALSSCPGHEIWRRDFRGSASVFSIVFREQFDAAAVARFADSLQLFKAGYSWGGVTSLVMTYAQTGRLAHYGGRIVRLNIGLEDPDDLISDLGAALARLS